MSAEVQPSCEKGQQNFPLAALMPRRHAGFYFYKQLKLNGKVGIQILEKRMLNFLGKKFLCFGRKKLPVSFPIQIIKPCDGVGLVKSSCAIP